MSVIDNATKSVENLPKGVWFGAIGIGGGIGVIYLIRHRNAPADPNATVDPAAPGYPTQPTATPDYSYGGSYAGDGSVGGGSVQAYDPQSVVQPGTNPIPLSGVVDLLTTLWGLQPPGAAQTGGGMTDGSADTHLPPQDTVPVVAAPTPTPVNTGVLATKPPQPVSNKPQPASCPPTHPFANPSYKAAPWGCYRVVLKGKERWHYYYDGREVKT